MLDTFVSTSVALCLCAVCAHFCKYLLLSYHIIIFFLLFFAFARLFAHIFPLAEKNEAAILIKKKKRILKINIM